MNISKRIHHKFNHLMANYQGKTSRPRYKFLRQIAYGLLSSRHVHLNKIGSLLGESIRLKKTTERLSRHLGNADLGDELLDAHLEIHSRPLQRCDYLIGDLSDISKSYARRMEGLERVYDGSKDGCADGYWLMNLIAVDSRGEQIIPAYSELYALKHPEEVSHSENSKILAGIEKVQQKTATGQFIVFDRGADRRVLLEHFLRNRRYFIIRQTGQRDLHTGEQRESLKKISRRIKLDTAMTVSKYRHGKVRRKDFDCGAMVVYLPREQGADYWPDPLWLVVVKQKGKGYCWFLCQLPTSDKRQAIEWAMQGYGLRWKIEEVHRQMKDDYRLEAICLKRYQALKNFNVIFWITISLIYYHFDQWRMQLLTECEIKVCYHEKWWEYDGFVYYKISRVISDIFRKTRLETIPSKTKEKPPLQLAFVNF